MTGIWQDDRNMTGRQEYDRTKDRQRILGKYMIDVSSKIWSLYLGFAKQEETSVCFYSSLERDFLRAAEPVPTVQRVRVTEHILPTVLSAADKQSSTVSGIQDLEQLERRMLLQEVKEIRQKSRQSLMEPIMEESELAFRSVWSIKQIGFSQSK